MHYHIIYAENPSVQPMAEPSIGFLRVLHAVAGAPNVDAYSNDRLIAEDLPYGQYIPYIPIVDGVHLIDLYVAGSKDSPLFTKTLTLNQDEALTVVASGTPSDIDLLAITASNMPTDTSNAIIRFAHLSPNAPAVDITLPDGTILFGNISFEQVTPYIPLLPSTDTLQVRVAGTPTVALTVPNIKLEPNKYSTLYAIGLAGGEPELGTLLVEDPTLPELLFLEGNSGIATP